MNVKTSIVKGMAWTIVEKVGTMLFQFCVSFLLLSLLTPGDYGIIAVLSIFSSISAVVVDGGLTAALLRKHTVTNRELTGVFAYNIMSGVLLYLLLLLLIQPLGAYYSKMYGLREIAYVFFLIVPISSFINVQTIVYSRKFDFASITRFTLWASFVSSAFAIGAAYAGLGIWALVIQRLSTPAIKAAIIWFNSNWRPSGKLTFKPLKAMFTYSSSIFTSDMLNAVLRNVPGFFIPKLYGEEQLGFFDQGQKIKDMPVQAVITSVQGVTLPTLAKFQDDTQKMGAAAHRIVAVMNFAMFPLMIGLIAVASDVFDILLDEIWMPSVPYLKIFCVTGLFAPLQVMAYNIMKIRCSGKTIFRYELIKKGIAVLVLIITIPMGVKAIVWGQCAIFIAETIANAIGASKCGDWKMRTHIREFVPYLSIALVMWLAVYAVRTLLIDIISGHAFLAAQIITGVAVYVGICALWRPMAWREMRGILKLLTNNPASKP